MIPAPAGSHANLVTVHVTNGTKSPAQWAEEITNKVLYIADTAAPPIREQAMIFREQLYRVVRDNIALAIEQEREWLYKQHSISNS